jgi:hypothetical protein
MKINKERFTIKSAKILLGILYFLNWLAIGGIITIMILSLIWQRFVVLEVEFFMQPTRNATAIDGVTYNLHSFSANLSITNPSLFASLIWMISYLIISCSAAFVIKQLQNIVGTMHQDGNPFILVNGKRIRRIAMLFFILPPLITVRNLILYSSLPDKLIVRGMEVQKWNIFNDEFIKYLIYFSIGFMLLLIAQVFYEGNRLKQENDLTV